MNSGSTSPGAESGAPLASPLLRLLAFWADLTLFSLSQALALVLGVLLFEGGSSWDNFVLFVLCLGFGLPFLYLCVANASGRQSLGAGLAGLQITDLKGRPLNLVANCVRTLLTLIFSSSCCLWAAFLPVALSGRRTLPDYIVRSRVITKSAPRMPVLLGVGAFQLVLFLALFVSVQIGVAPVQAFFIPSGAMEPTLHIGDRLLANRIVYWKRDPKVGEIVLFQAPDAALATSGTTTPQTFLQRCVGVPGDVVEMRRAKLFRNGVAVNEPYVIWKDGSPLGMAPQYMYDMKIVEGVVFSREYLGPNEPGEWARGGILVASADQKTITDAKPGKVPDGMYLVLGDHRNNSNDSHVWGFVPRALIKARAMGIYWPLSRRGGL